MSKKELDNLKVCKKSDAYYMRAAIKRARTAAERGEVPVGAVIVYRGMIISGGRNARETAKCATRHAEISAIEGACRKMGGWRLSGCEMYVTLEPCPMCAGAIINARLDKVHIACADEKAGSFGSRTDLNKVGYNHRCDVDFGLLENEARELLQNFFKSLRNKKKK